jgi:hypothetical protein
MPRPNLGLQNAGWPAYSETPGRGESARAVSPPRAPIERAIRSVFAARQRALLGADMPDAMFVGVTAEHL